MNWYALFFGPYYYAGHGKMKKGIIMALLSFLPITAIIINVYAALNANKELEPKNKPFNWASALITLAVGVASTIITLMLIVSS
jgi:hypothetical protein